MKLIARRSIDVKDSRNKRYQIIYPWINEEIIQRLFFNIFKKSVIERDCRGKLVAIHCSGNIKRSVIRGIKYLMKSTTTISTLNM